MWPHSKLNSKDSIRLRELLGEVRRLVEQSGDSDWTPFTAAEIAADLSCAISHLERGEPVDTGHLKMLFAPTGPIQETSMSADWAETYLKLSTDFDDLIKSA